MSPTVLTTGRRLTVCTLLLCCAAMLWQGTAAAATPAVAAGGSETPAHESFDDAATGRSGNERSGRLALRLTAATTATARAVETATPNESRSVRPHTAAPSHDPPGRAPPSE
jgi:hypothetical protein